MNPWVPLRLALVASLGCLALVAGLLLYATNLWWVPLLPLLLLLKRRRAAPDEFGTARTATHAEVNAVRGPRFLGLFHVPPDRFRGLKALFDFRRPAADAVRAFLAKPGTGEWTPVGIEVVHHTVVAPTGAGKGVCHVVPLLLLDDSSAVVIDVKGELYRTTAGERRKAGHEVVLLDPMNVIGDAE